MSQIITPLCYINFIFPPSSLVLSRSTTTVIPHMSHYHNILQVFSKYMHIQERVMVTY